ncbi:MAG TPA: malto-oligosyltrehalose synthase [Actinomycetota bacterium]|nr:malto-oligosyltrehalose synthase [Actinomycetota bacterium]
MPERAPRREIVPTATYRLQLRQGVTLADARDAVPYLRALGVSHLYLSPPFAATGGSTHGYDVTDPNRIDPSLGTEDDLRALADELHAEGMGLLVDIVPNHMAASPQNPMWRDLLARGKRSRAARVFDVDLDALDGKTLLPILTAPLHAELADGAFEVDEDELRYRGFGLPLSDETADRVRRQGVDAINGNPHALRDVIERQRYELAPWQDEEGRRNYRRFFDITDLVGVRQEDRRVFRQTHELVSAWVRDGLVDGLRIDHVDGLRDPRGYLEHLASRVRPPWVVVEKILAPDEELPEAWPVDGTTGYEATIDVNDLFVDPRGWERLGRVVRTFRGGAGEDYDTIRAASRREALEMLFAVELDSLARSLERFATMTSERAPSLGALRAALLETTAEMDVYRTYVDGSEVGRDDARRIRSALSRARKRLDGGGRGALATVRRALLVEADDPEARALALDVVARWQQLTGPAAAKGEEDTALYRDARLISRNEVGGDPGTPPRSVDEVHRRFAVRGRRWPRTMVATSTHDTKRGEDTRMRIDVLSELHDEYADAVERWSDMNAHLRRRVGDREAPSPAEELMLYQTLLGIWPVHGRPSRDLGERVRRFLEKALREAKVNSSWRSPDEAYERAVMSFAEGVLSKRRSAAFVADLASFAERVAFHGAVNSLSQVVFRCIVPGVPDLYQGSAAWNLALVDPDNRTPPDLGREEQGLRRVVRIADPRPLLERWPTGEVKRFVTARTLRYRREHPELFGADARYLPVAARGRHADRVIAAARRNGRSWVVAVAPRFSTKLAEAGTWPLGDVWGRTSVELPSGAPARWRDIYTSDEVEVRAGGLPVADALARFPVALLGSA